jgi:hypothetical protein
MASVSFDRSVYEVRNMGKSPVRTKLSLQDARRGEALVALLQVRAADRGRDTPKFELRHPSGRARYGRGLHPIPRVSGHPASSPGCRPAPGSLPTSRGRSRYPRQSIFQRRGCCSRDIEAIGINGKIFNFAQLCIRRRPHYWPVSSLSPLSGVHASLRVSHLTKKAAASVGSRSRSTVGTTESRRDFYISSE